MTTDSPDFFNREKAATLLQTKFKVIENGDTTVKDATEENKPNGNGHLGIHKKQFAMAEVVRIMTAFADNAVWDLESGEFDYLGGSRDEGCHSDAEIFDCIKTERMTADPKGWLAYLTYWRVAYVGRLEEERKPKKPQTESDRIAALEAQVRDLTASLLRNNTKAS